MQVLQKVKEFEEKYNVKVIYLTKFGSQLHGTQTPKSDTDYFGLFVPSLQDVVLKKDLDHLKSETNKERNTSEDTDFELHSVYKFLHNVSKGETGAMDLLFSMFRVDTQIIFEPEAQLIKNEQKGLVSKKVNKFVGYCIAQAKKYGVKGARFEELERFHNKVKYMKGNKIREHWVNLEALIQKEDFKYISLVTQTEPMGENTYVNVLGKLYQDTLSCQEFKNKISDNFAQYGDRTKASKDGTDWKAVSHALRVITEAETLLTEKFITFPLPNADYLRDIKQGKIDLEEVLNAIDTSIDRVNALFETSDLPPEVEESLLDRLVFKLVYK